MGRVDPSPPLVTHGEVFQIPDRWRNRAAVEDQLLRRVLEWLSVQNQGLVGPKQLVALLDRFVGQLEQYDVGRVPLSLPLAWYAAMEARELDQLVAAAGGGPIVSAFMAEVNAWFGGTSRLPSTHQSGPALEQKGEQLRNAIR